VTRRAVFWALVGVQALVPFGIAGLNETRLAGSKDVLLRVQPVDPHDLFRGEYVSLSYPISTLSAPAGTVYVPLYRSGDEWTGSAATAAKPEGGTFIRGRSNGSGRIAYGIETFYVEEGTARRYEEALFDRRLYARVAVDDDGQARLRELVIR
jgi:uncharacterized membrane-anchored protein